MLDGDSTIKYKEIFTKLKLKIKNTLSINDKKDLTNTLENNVNRDVKELHNSLEKIDKSMEILDNMEDNAGNIDILNNIKTINDTIRNLDNEIYNNNSFKEDFSDIIEINDNNANIANKNGCYKTMDTNEKQKNDSIIVKLNIIMKNRQQKTNNTFIKTQDLTNIETGNIQEINNITNFNNKPLIIKNKIKKIRLNDPIESNISSSKILKFARISLPINKQDEEIIPIENSEMNYNNKIINLCSFKKLINLPKKSFLEEEYEGCVKIAEATYSEVFMKIVEGEALVYKIVPFENTNLEKFYKEVYILKNLANIDGQNYSNYKNAYIVEGDFPSNLLKEWYNFREKYPAQSINKNPKLYKSYHGRKKKINKFKYGIIIMNHGGQELEKSEIFKSLHDNSYKDVYNLFYLLTKKLDKLEKYCKFEHRDLHWSNILVKPLSSSPYNQLLNFNDFHFDVNLIDFSLSRFQNGEGLVFIDLKHENWIFGENNEQAEEISQTSNINSDEVDNDQYDVYRWMKIVNGNDWKKYKPRTNVLWVRYLINKMIENYENVYRKSIHKINDHSRCKISRENEHNIKKIDFEENDCTTIDYNCKYVYNQDKNLSKIREVLRKIMGFTFEKDSAGEVYYEMKAHYDDIM